MKETLGAIESGKLYQPYYENVEPEKKGLSYVLVSGGPDSAGVLNLVHRQSIYRDTGEEVRGLFVNFGQPYYEQELEAAKKVAIDAGVIIEELQIPCISEAYRDKGELGYPIFRELLPTVIGAAALHAIFNGAGTLYHGNILEDEKDIPGTLKFFEKMQEAINALPGAEDFKIIIPFRDIPKAEVFVRALELDVQFTHTVSCLQEGGHCGKCRACLRRAQAFQEADIHDPTSYIEDPLK